jgi:hypothetical protein
MDTETLPFLLVSTIEERSVYPMINREMSMFLLSVYYPT